MSRLVPEIKRRLVHRVISIADAMRMLREEAGDLLTGYRLKWLEHELNGYELVPGLITDQPFDVPEYRRVNGTYFAKTKSGLWADVTDTKIADIASFVPVPIAVIEDIVNNPLNELVDIQLGELLENTPIVIQLHRSQLLTVDEAVRNTLINLLDELTGPL